MRLQPHRALQGLRGNVKPALLLGILAVFFVVISLFNFWFRAYSYDPAFIQKDLKTLQEIFITIDNDCKILGFDFQRNPINYLNVGTFKSSELGSMNLAYPHNWKGPYLNDNLQVQNKEYQIVSTKKGYFITPGDNVLLPNGKTIGKEIILNEDADIEQLMRDDNALSFKGQPLAIALPLQTSTVQKIMIQAVGALDDGI